MLNYGRHGNWLRVFCVGLVLISGCANTEQIEADKADWLEFAKQDLGNWPGRLIEDSKDTFTDPNNLLILGIAGGASIAMHNSQADDKIQSSVEHHRAVDGFFSESLNTLGCPGTHFAAAGLWYALSAQNQDQLNKNRAWTMMTALAVNGLVTVGLKAARNNENPNGDRWAWPSGHTSSSFTVAAVLDEFYGPKIGIPAYALASLVGYRMLEEGDHWASDAVFGAALGWTVGHTVAGKHKQLEIAGFKVLPAIASSDRSSVGITLVKQF